MLDSVEAQGADCSGRPIFRVHWASLRLGRQLSATDGWASLLGEMFWASTIGPQEGCLITH